MTRIHTDMTHALGKGAMSLTKAQFAAWQGKARTLLGDLKREKETDALELLSIVDRSNDIAAAAPVAAHLLKDTRDLVILGVGGSSLGAQTVAQLTGCLTQGWRDPEGAPRLHFFDNLDGETYARAFANFDWPKTRFLVVSKSGSTGETLLQALAAIKALEDAGGGKYLKHHFAFLTEPGGNPLRKLAGELGSPVADHPTGIGGRYSVLSLVGLLPAMLMGLDPIELRGGARDALNLALAGDPEISPAASGAALRAGVMYEKGLRQVVLWSYADRLERFGLWWRQLWGESIGKNGKGSAPLNAVGPVDQHSQQQLYLAGPDDRHITFLVPPHKGVGPRADAARAAAIGANYLADKTPGDLVAAQALATAETLVKHGRPVRVMRVETLDARALGELLMHFMLETILACRLVGVDPFDQPAVEESKVLARQYLAEGRG